MAQESSKEAGDDRPSQEEVRAYLRALLAHEGLDASERNKRFLSYVVEETLAGHGSRIKAYNIALAAFDRGKDFDPLTDPIVRIEAGRLRRSLDHYYLTAGKQDRIRIDIPKGAYVAVFTLKDRDRQDDHARPSEALPKALELAQASQASPDIATNTNAKRLATLAGAKPEVRGGWSRWRWSAVASAVALTILVAAYAGSKVLEQPHEVGEFESLGAPSVLILPFENAGINPAQDFIARGLTFEVITHLTRYNELFVYGPDTSFNIETAPGAVRAKYVLSGTVQTTDDRLRVSTILSESHTAQTVWSRSFDRDLTTGGLLDIELDIASQVANAIAQPYGIVFNRTAAEISSKPAQELKSYECVVRFRQHWREYDPRNYEDLLACLEQAIKDDPGFARAYSSLALLNIDRYRFGFLKDKIATDPLQEALELSQKSLELDPDNSEGYLALMMTHWFLHEPERTFEDGERGLARNPHNTDLLAELGFRYALMMRWDRSMPLIAEAFVRNPMTPSGYRIATFHYHYTQGDYKAALAEAEQVKAPFVLYGHVCRAMAYAQLGDNAKAEAAVAEILKIDPNYGDHIEADLAKRGNSPAIIRAAIEGLSKAGLKITKQ